MNATTPKPIQYNTICYAYVGCFDNYPPFDNADLDLPRSPEAIGTEFLLYTRRSWNTSQHLNYSSLVSITNSLYKPSLKTKVIIHGFTNSIKSTWLYEMKDAFLKKVGRKCKTQLTIEMFSDELTTSEFAFDLHLCLMSKHFSIFCGIQEMCSVNELFPHC